MKQHCLAKEKFKNDLESDKAGLDVDSTVEFHIKPSLVNQAWLARIRLARLGWIKLDSALTA